MRKSDVLAYYGTQQRVADALGCAQRTVSGWGDIIPLERAFAIEDDTAGELKVDLTLYPNSKPSPKSTRQPSQ